MTDETRVEFERWYEAESMPSESDWFRREDDDPDEYFYATTHLAWEAWRIALTAERTRCAAIARAAGREDIAAEIEGTGE